MDKLQDKMLGALYDNKSDEADEGSWTESKDYHKAAEACADISKENSIAFVEWASDYVYETNGVAKQKMWWKQGRLIGITTEDLYSLFQSQQS